jgi:hypothetical protein
LLVDAVVVCVLCELISGLLEVFGLLFKVEVLLELWFGEFLVVFDWKPI